MSFASCFLRMYSPCIGIYVVLSIVAKSQGEVTGNVAGSSSATKQNEIYGPTLEQQKVPAISSNYQQPISSGYQQPISSGYQQPIISSYQQPISSGYLQPMRWPTHVHEPHSESASSGPRGVLLAWAFYFLDRYRKALAAMTTTQPCLSWGSWTDCPLDGSRGRTRACLTGTQTESGVCFIDCLEWTTWTTCDTSPIIVDQKQSRTRECKNGQESQEKACHTATTEGMTSDNWYRAGNGYEYTYVSSATTYSAATSSCNSLDSTSTLAAAGVRDLTLMRSSFYTALSIPTTIARFYVGATDSLDDGNWIFQDGQARSEDSIIWGESTSGASQPSGGATQNCMSYFNPGATTTNTVGSNDETCSDEHTFVCERLVAQ